MDKRHYNRWSDEDLKKEALKYSTLSDFKNNASSQYRQSLKRGKEFFDNITSHITRKCANLSKNELKQIALRYEYKGEFQKYDKAAYLSALRRGREFFNDITSHMKNKLNYWTDEILRNEALKYQTKLEFKKNNFKAYQAAMSKGKNFWYDVTSHMDNSHFTRWTKELLTQEALKHNTLTDFKQKSKGAHSAAKKIGIDFFNLITSHMPQPKRWTYEELKNEALKYTTKSDFRKNNRNAYQVSKERKILNDICTHMEKIGSKYSRIIYTYEFSDNSVYVGLTYKPSQRHSDHMSKKNSAVFLYMEKTGLVPIKKIMTDFLNKDDASEMETEILNKYRNEGWKILNRTKTGGLGGFTRRWTPENIEKEALKYDTLTEFYKNSRAVTVAAKKIGEDFYKKIISHMKRTTVWTEELLREESQNYKTRTHFARGSTSAYYTSKKRGLLDKFFPRKK
jgi:predicted GIY-YIG superfamily endonuclease